MSAYANVQALIKAAYSNLGIVDLESDLSAAQYDQGLNSLNAMLGAWSRKRITLQCLFDETYTLVNGQASYAIGSGLDFVTTKPIDVDNAFIRDANGTDFPLGIIGPNQYDAIPVKTIKSRPSVINYNPRIGTVTFYAVPDYGYEFHWTVQKLITSFVLGDSITLPDEYEEAIEYNLAIRLAPKLNIDIPKEVVILAAQSLAVLTIPVEPVQVDCFVGRGRYNIFADKY